jgi:hypothetical protein
MSVDLMISVDVRMYPSSMVPFDIASCLSEVQFIIVSSFSIECRFAVRSLDNFSNNSFTSGSLRFMAWSKKHAVQAGLCTCESWFFFYSPHIQQS